MNGNWTRRLFDGFIGVCIGCCIMGYIVDNTEFNFDLASTRSINTVWWEPQDPEDPTVIEFNERLIVLEFSNIKIRDRMDDLTLELRELRNTILQGKYDDK